jgi:hypothetical protein
MLEPGIGLFTGFAEAIQGAWPSLFHKTDRFNLSGITTVQ